MTAKEAKYRSFFLGLGVLVLCLGATYLVRQQGEFFCNSHFGFGLFGAEPFFLALEGVVMGVLVWRWLTLAWCAEKMIFSILILAGGLNFLERLFLGCVADYLTLPYIGSQVNLPDIFITSMLGVLLVSSWTKSSE